MALATSTKNPPVAAGRLSPSASRWPEWTALGAYTALLIFLIRHHEPWADEAQAWLLARDLSVWQLVHTYLRYEGQPALWHLMLWLLIRVHVTYAGMHWICGVVGLCGTWLLLVYSPFPRWLKLSLPFSFLLAYQYVVVARSYVLMPILLYGVAIVWRRNPIVLALLLGLMANTAAHGAAIAAGFGVAYWIERRRDIRGGKLVPSSRSFLLASILLLMMGVAALAAACPTPDVTVPARLTGMNRQVQEFVVLMTATWQPWPAAIPGGALVLIGLERRKALYLTAPLLALLLFFSAVYMNFWHAGLTVLVLITILWITWPAHGQLALEEKLLRCAVAILVATHIGWTAYAAWYETAHDYSPDLRTAQYLAPAIRAGVPIASSGDPTSSFDLVGIQPYFSRNIFSNQPHAFWLWSRNPARPALSGCPQQCPGIIVFKGHAIADAGPGHGYVPSDEASRTELLQIEAHGYELDRVICGAPPMSLGAWLFSSGKEAIRTGCYFALKNSRPDRS